VPKIYLLLAAAKPQSSAQFFALCGILGMVLLADILCIMLLSSILGLWVTMAALALLTGAGFSVSHVLLQARVRAVINSSTLGLFDEDAFSSYFCTLVASILLTVPGIISTFLGIAFAIPPASIKVGGKLARYMGISWQKTYEYLRLN